MRAAGLSRTSRIRDISTAGSAAVAQTHVGRGGAAGTVLRGTERQLVLRVTHYPAYAVSQTLDGEGGGDPDLPRDRARSGGDQPHRPGQEGAAHRGAHPTGDGAWQARRNWHCRCPRPTPRSSASSRARCGCGSATGPVSTPRSSAPPGTVPSPGVIDDPTVVRRLTRSKGGELEVLDRVPVATDYTLSDGRLRVTVHSSLAIDSFTPVLYTRDHEVTGTTGHPSGSGYQRECRLRGYAPWVRRAGAAQGPVRRHPAGRG